MEGYGFQAIEVEPSELDACVTVGGSVGPGVVEDGRFDREDGLGEGQLVVVGSVEVEEILGHPGEICDPGAMARLFRDL